MVDAPTPPVKGTDSWYREQDRATDFGNLEFSWDLTLHGSDPLSELGRRSSTPSFSDNPDEAQFDPFSNTVSVGPNYAQSPVWNHEFRHAGLNYIHQNYNPTTLQEEFGPWVSAALIGIPEERLVEMFDDPEAITGVGSMSDTIQYDPEGVVQGKLFEALLLAVAQKIINEQDGRHSDDEKLQAINFLLDEGFK